MDASEVGQDTFFYGKNTLRAGDKILRLSPPVIMGILNVTPDSFSDAGRFTDPETALARAAGMLQEGASIIDVGGYSTRPGAKDVSPDAEAARVIPVIRLIREKFPDSLISVDTFRSVVAEKAVEAGASLVNDVSGGQMDPKMFETVGRLGCPYIMMHMRGTPATMQKETEYGNILLSLWSYFRDRIQEARDCGITEIILDPGFGFAKTIDQNYYILENLSYFHSLGLPLMVGLSRKSLIYKRLKIAPEEAVNGSSVLNTIAVRKGAGILRVHDVRQAREVIELTNFLRNSRG